MKHILFLCTGNSCRSILAEAYVNHQYKNVWQAHSAGSTPTGAVHPMALDVLKGREISVDGYHSKNWDVFGLQSGKIPMVEMDYIITVCDNAAGEACPVWPGHPATHHWPFPDPTKFSGDKASTREYFEDVCDMIIRKIDDELTSRLKS
ncbi:MAG: arsenate reductase ArsC [Pseudomonadota bacterium]|nr:arsenate reductase ArsC [Pseudomonadota bacterium]